MTLLFHLSVILLASAGAAMLLVGGYFWLAYNIWRWRTQRHGPDS